MNIRTAEIERIERRGTLGMSAAVCLLLLVPTGPAYSGTATEAVKDTSDEVIRLLNDKELKRPGRGEQRRLQLEKVIGDRFSYDEMSKRALGAQWTRLNAQEQQEFVRAFTRLLANSYVDKIEGYSHEQVRYVNERLEKGYAEVRTKIVSSTSVLPLDFRLLESDGEWRVYDIVVDGISLVNNYRGQFARILRTSSYPHLMQRLQEKSDNPASASSIAP